MNGHATTNNSSTPSLKGCYATLITKAKYLQGFLVLHDSFLRADPHAFTKHPFVVLVTPALPFVCVRILEDLPGVKVKVVESVHVEGHEVDAHDARFADTWTKLRGFECVEYEVSLRAARTRSVERRSGATSLPNSRNRDRGGGRLMATAVDEHRRTDGAEVPECSVQRLFSRATTQAETSKSERWSGRGSCQQLSRAGYDCYPTTTIRRDIAEVLM